MVQLKKSESYPQFQYQQFCETKNSDTSHDTPLMEEIFKDITKYYKYCSVQWGFLKTRCKSSELLSAMLLISVVIMTVFAAYKLQMIELKEKYNFVLQENERLSKIVASLQKNMYLDENINNNKETPSEQVPLKKEPKYRQVYYHNGLWGAELIEDDAPMNQESIAKTSIEEHKLDSFPEVCREASGICD